MTREEKSALIDDLAQEFTDAAGIIVCDYKGMNVQQMEGLRTAAFDKDVRVRVVKNTLAAIAMERAGKSGYEFSDTNLLLWGPDLVALAKMVVAYEKENDKFFVIKGGHIEGEPVDKAKVEAYSTLPSKEELLGMLLSTWTAPARNLLYVWGGVSRNFVTVLDNIKQQKEGAA